ncbi:MAG: hypothetical protein UW37_C0046G0005 [Candidatus Gottesmanbacteria bacterium GW2011_GWA2_44_17]|uniref:Uncharacterized protein n=1 Tax=Candidatus Gottesmanbacteria bacterium GW2011_GWA2_44_17 TaxID=1618444 RepID=A0A0G1HDL3_9BACT|nr:MAG: hypothetical protein UW37_C0046G0005 [Candidatus Gottesmanbacteria bacterium GW2011_GWA2_44_17]
MATPLDFFGSSADAPEGVLAYGENVQGLILLFNNILKVAIYGSMAFALINFLVSGIQYIGSAGNPELVKTASARIWISLLGLLVAGGSLVLAGILGLVFFGDALAIINPKVYGP